MDATPQTSTLLASLPREEYARVAPRLSRIELPLGKVLQEAGEAVRDMYFPTGACIVSLLYAGREGESTEIAVVGNEGLVGVAAYLGGKTFPSRSVVQNAGSAWVLDGDFVAREFDLSSAFRQRLLLFAQALMTQMAQTAVCNRHHHIEQQLCRWLLLSFDRAGADTLDMTQELISNMLGVRRVGITEAANALRRKRIIGYHRGCIRLMNRDALEARACECYGVINREYRRLLD